MLRIFETSAQRERRLRLGIDEAHQLMAHQGGAVGVLARLYDTLQQAAEAGRAPGFTTNSDTDVTRLRAVFSGGIAFTGYNISGTKVKVDLRRATTRYSKGSGYADLSVFTRSNKDQDRVRLKLYTHRQMVFGRFGCRARRFTPYEQ